MSINRVDVVLLFGPIDDKFFRENFKKFLLCSLLQLWQGLCTDKERSPRCIHDMVDSFHTRRCRFGTSESTRKQAVFMWVLMEGLLMGHRLVHHTDGSTFPTFDVPILSVFRFLVGT